MPITGTADAANARIDLFVDYTATAGTQTTATVYRRVGNVNADNEYVRGLYAWDLLGEQAYLSDTEAPLDQQIWYVVEADGDPDTVMTAGPFTLPSDGYVWMKDPGRPWADIRMDLCETPQRLDGSCPDPPLVTDTFERTVASGWGSADTGQAWAGSGGAAADYAVGGGVGTQTHTAAGAVRRDVITPGPVDTDQQIDFMIPVMPLTDVLSVSLLARFTDATHFYRVRAAVQPSGQVWVSLLVANGTETLLSTVYVEPFSFVAGAWFTMRFQVTGSRLRAKVWPVGIPETTTWDITVTDTALAAAGSTGVQSITGAASANTFPVTFSLDNYRAGGVSTLASQDIAWIGFQDKTRAADAAVYSTLNEETPSSVYGRRKDITTSGLFLSRTADGIRAVYELYTAGGPLLWQVPAVYVMDRFYGQKDRYYQPGDLEEQYLTNDQRKPVRLWTVPLTAVEAPVGRPQGTDDANWCAVRDTYGTFADLTDSGYTWGEVDSGEATAGTVPGEYGGGAYGDGPYGG